jgi:predicted nucleic acid-binding protein
MRKGLVLDANILIRAVLGMRVRTLLERYEESCEFCSPDVCFLEARRHLPQILGNRGLDAGPALGVLDGIARLVQPIEQELYRSFEAVARTRIAPRNLRDWPVVALALALNLSIWTEDQDFFGSGIATWTTDRVEIYLREG